MSTQHSDEYDEAYPLGDGRQEIAKPTGVKRRAERIVSSGNWPDVGATDNWLGIPANARQFRVLCCCNLVKLVDQEKKESKGRLKKKSLPLQHRPSLGGIRRGEIAWFEVATNSPFCVISGCVGRIPAAGVG